MIAQNHLTSNTQMNPVLTSVAVFIFIFFLFLETDISRSNNSTWCHISKQVTSFLNGARKTEKALIYCFNFSIFEVNSINSKFKLKDFSLNNGRNRQENML